MVGRELELDAAARFLDSVAVGARALVLQGEPGIGKTTLWRATLDLAWARGIRVLACRPAQAEAKLSYAGLTDLLADVSEDVLDELPAPQRRALRIALLESDPDETASSARIVYAAFSGLLARLAAESPVVVGIDDVQWLDRPSRRALEFALRRLGSSRVGVVAAERLVDGSRSAPTSLARVLDDVGAERVELGPLSLGALHAVVRAALGRVPPRPTLLRLASASRGNPFYAIEIARALGTTELSPGEALPLPADISELVAARIRGLPPRARRALLTAALHASPTLELLGSTSLARAEEAGLVDVRDGRVTFVHPLFASAVYAAASAETRRSVHRRLAARVSEPEQRARHLALAATRPSRAIAKALEEAASDVRARGSPVSAAELLDLAVRLTPHGDREARERRQLAAAEQHFHAGDLGRAGAHAEQVLGTASGDRARAAALRVLGEVRYHESSFAEAVPLFEEALPMLGDDLHAVELHVDLAYAYVNLGDLSAAAPHGRAAVAAARRTGNEGMLAVALAVSVIVGFYAGEALDRAGLEEALALEDPFLQVVMPMRPSLIGGIVLHVSDELARSEELFRSLRDRTLELGEDSDLPLLDAQLAMVIRRSGRPLEALAFAEEGCEIARVVGSATGEALALAERCHCRGLLGDVQGARADGREAQRLAAETGYWFGDAWARWGLGALAIALGEHASAVGELMPIAELVERKGGCDPISATFLPDTIEALVGAGEIARADALSGMLEEHARRHDLRSSLAGEARGRALALAARRDLEGARRHALRAVAESSSDLPLERGRALLVLGRLERRARRKRAAREAIDAAGSVFETVGAEPWAARARAELERTGVRHVPSDELTPSERRVSELAAEGLTNRRIADALFVSHKTVEANLGRAYRKLGIHSRVELARALADRERSLTV
jgi:DNA-binding CsgD family transcriptional regulator